jgi:hypothetical protein
MFENHLELVVPVDRIVADGSDISTNDVDQDLQLILMILSFLKKFIYLRIILMKKQRIKKNIFIDRCVIVNIFCETNKKKI